MLFEGLVFPKIYHQMSNYHRLGIKLNNAKQIWIKEDTKAN